MPKNNLIGLKELEAPLVLQAEGELKTLLQKYSNDQQHSKIILTLEEVLDVEIDYQNVAKLIDLF